MGSNTQTINSSQSAAANNPIAPPLPFVGLNTPAMVPPTSIPRGGFYFGVNGNSSTATRPNNVGTFIPVRIDTPITVQGVAIEVVTAGNSGATLRLALYGDGGAPSGALANCSGPKTLINDYGNVAADTTGIKSAFSPSPIILTPGWYWLGAVAQNAATTQPVCRALTPGAMSDAVTRVTGGGFTAAGYQGTYASTWPGNVGASYSATDTAYILTLLTL